MYQNNNKRNVGLIHDDNDDDDDDTEVQLMSLCDVVASSNKENNVNTGQHKNHHCVESSKNVIKNSSNNNISALKKKRLKIDGNWANTVKDFMSELDKNSIDLFNSPIRIDHNSTRGDETIRNTKRKVPKSTSTTSGTTGTKKTVAVVKKPVTSTITSKSTPIETITISDSDDDDDHLYSALFDTNINTVSKEDAKAIQTAINDLEQQAATVAANSTLSEADNEAIQAAIRELEEQAATQNVSTTLSEADNEAIQAAIRELEEQAATQNVSTTLSDADNEAIQAAIRELEEQAIKEKSSTTKTVMSEADYKAIQAALNELNAIPATPVDQPLSEADAKAIQEALTELETSHNSIVAGENISEANAIAIQFAFEQLNGNNSSGSTNFYIDHSDTNEKYKSISEHQTLVESYSVIDPHLEILDPNPDIHQLYRQCDRLYFGGFLALTAVQIGWAENFFSLAGAYYSSRQGVPTILLSANLLRFRPRRDMLETLLHEMIHAYIHQAAIRDRGDHGPQFCSHMQRINREAGTDITIYHNFHEEVDHLRKYVWRCTGGICQRTQPYNGYIYLPTKRRPNRSDRAFRIHLEKKCTGKFEKVTNFNNVDEGLFPGLTSIATITPTTTTTTTITLVVGTSTGGIGTSVTSGTGISTSKYLMIVGNNKKKTTTTTNTSHLPPQSKTIA